MEGDVPVGLLDLLPVGPAGGSMLAVANRLGLDVVQIPTSGEVRAAAMSRSIPPASKINMIVCGVINSPHFLLQCRLFLFLLLFQNVRLILDGYLCAGQRQLQPAFRQLSFFRLTADARL